MLVINVPISESFDEANNVFVTEEFTLELEHSLASISKWEQKFEKPFLGDGEKSAEETVYYINCMLLTPDVPEVVLSKLTAENVKAINDHIGAKMTATWFAEDTNQRKTREVITAEVIYHWMVASEIPFECQYWHLNRLITLIRVCQHKAKGSEKMSRQGRQTALQKQRELNRKRREAYGTSG